MHINQWILVKPTRQIEGDRNSSRAHSIPFCSWFHCCCHRWLPLLLVPRTPLCLYYICTPKCIYIWSFVWPSLWLLSYSFVARDLKPHMISRDFVQNNSPHYHMKSAIKLNDTFFHFFSLIYTRNRKQKFGVYGNKMKISFSESSFTLYSSLSLEKYCIWQNNRFVALLVYLTLHLNHAYVHAMCDCLCGFARTKSVRIPMCTWARPSQSLPHCCLTSALHNTVLRGFFFIIFLLFICVMILW